MLVFDGLFPVLYFNFCCLTFSSLCAPCTKRGWLCCRTPYCAENYWRLRWPDIKIPFQYPYQTHKTIEDTQQALYIRYPRFIQYYTYNIWFGSLLLKQILCGWNIIRNFVWHPLHLHHFAWTSDTRSCTENNHCTKYR